MSKQTLLAAGILIPLTLSVAMPAVAQGPAGPRGMVFEELDLDGDGQITLEELTNRGEARFAETDTDGDGALSRDEMIAAGRARVEARVDRMLEAADADGDGQITQDEIAALREDRRETRQARMFERLDADGDGAISAEEFEAMSDRFQGRRGHGWGRDRG